MSKFAEFQRAEAELQAATARFNRLKEDKAVQRIAEFNGKLAALMEEYQVTDSDLLIARGLAAEPSQGGRKQIVRTIRRFTRIKTGESHEGKNPNKDVKAWLEEDGPEGVTIEEI
ncbi:hypothetical protein C6380_14330 [Pseudomonas syringae pv. actinidiae]|uniref:hypothetical protein n=1 Tax=Pseudomonas syringae TaxID=317 RepID=UPI000BB547C3|nr:hypothetical protein [Pseudomonas syringae]PBK49583.1 hypothetical protein BUE61_22585 [Pseudomonas syringae pv. actinidiae]PBK54243.1 hypothetical protein BUE60_10390 [Pseudomonas syringae pv. actinidiae]RJX53473.1 hypothetical protein C6379_17475 [Pseudomonas syringae pv. actinidiae]RJX55591.1 hypothetical protein C6380_14330 [Pseudomonas syringae pv. actinidiae]RJX63851.1 hypothetical protein C6383_05055 [Pseudomonas syringae pv. actinidiae]